MVRLTRLTRSTLDGELALGQGAEGCVLESATVYAWIEPKVLARLRVVIHIPTYTGEYRIVNG